MHISIYTYSYIYVYNCGTNSFQFLIHGHTFHSQLYYFVWSTYDFVYQWDVGIVVNMYISIGLSSPTFARWKSGMYRTLLACLVSATCPWAIRSNGRWSLLCVLSCEYGFSQNPLSSIVTNIIYMVVPDMLHDTSLFSYTYMYMGLHHFETLLGLIFVFLCILIHICSYIHDINISMAYTLFFPMRYSKTFHIYK